MLQLLNNIQHKDLRIITAGAPNGATTSCRLAVTVDEFRKLQAHYPIVFQPDGKGGFVPTVPCSACRTGRTCS